jgi:hypothetical protein
VKLGVKLGQPSKAHQIFVQPRRAHSEVLGRHRMSEALIQVKVPHPKARNPLGAITSPWTDGEKEAIGFTSTSSIIQDLKINN